MSKLEKVLVVTCALLVVALVVHAVYVVNSHEYQNELADITTTTVVEGDSTCAEYEPVTLGDGTMRPVCVDIIQPTKDAVFCTWHEQDDGRAYKFCTSWPR